MISLITFIVSYILWIICAFKKKSGSLILSPMFWFIVSWTLLIGLYYVSGITYNVSIELTTDIYLIVNLLIFITFYYIGRNVILTRTVSLQIQIEETDYHKYINTKIYFIISIIGIMMWLFDIIRLNSISFGSRIDNFNISFIGTFGLVLNSISLIVWLYELAYSIRFNNKPSFIAYVAAACFIVPAIMTAGRQAIMIIILTTVIISTYSLSKNRTFRYKKYIKIVFVLGIFIILSYLILISAVRTMVSSKQALFEYMFNSYTSSTTVKFANQFGPLREVVLESLYYYSHEIPMFAVLYQKYNFGPAYGMSQLHYIARRLPSFLNPNDSIQSYLVSLYYDQGLSSHVWRTIIANSIIDFGKVGGVFFIAILGFAVGKKNSVFRKNNSIYNLVFQSVICTGVVFSIQFSPFAEQSWAYPFYWLLILPTIKKIVRNKHKSLKNEESVS